MELKNYIPVLTVRMPTTTESGRMSIKVFYQMCGYRNTSCLPEQNLCSAMEVSKHPLSNGRSPQQGAWLHLEQPFPEIQKVLAILWWLASVRLSLNQIHWKLNTQNSISVQEPGSDPQITNFLKNNLWKSYSAHLAILSFTQTIMIDIILRCYCKI